MHTASFGRVNSFYARGALNDTTIKKMTMLQNADIILANKGVPSFGKKSTATRTMRAEAMSKGIPSIMVEYGSPQVFQPKMIERGTKGIHNLLIWLKMQPKKIIEKNESVICKKSYWIYIKEGGYLEIHAELTQLLKKGELIATLRNPFGEIIKEYFCPENGIVIGKSTNPINMSGGRILHLGILK